MSRKTVDLTGLWWVLLFVTAALLLPTHCTEDSPSLIEKLAKISIQCDCNHDTHTGN